MSKSDKAKTISRWVSTEKTRKNHDTIFNKDRKVSDKELSDMYLSMGNIDTLLRELAREFILYGCTIPEEESEDP